MTPVEALQLALEKEKTSIELYSKLAASHVEIKDLLYALLTEEEKHKKMIEQKITEITKY
jgi:rubrerythrin